MTQGETVPGSRSGIEDDWAKEEAQQQQELRERSAALMADLQSARERYAARGIRLRIEIDNDCWSVAPAIGSGLSDEEYDEAWEDLRKINRHDEHPCDLSCLFAVALGFDAGRP